MVLSLPSLIFSSEILCAAFHMPHQWLKWVTCNGIFFLFTECADAWQGMSRDSLSDASPNHAKSPDGSSDVAVHEADGTVKSLTEKLTSALSSIKAKEDLVKQHAKVAEEAVLGEVMLHQV